MSKPPQFDVRNLVCKGSIGDAFLFNCILYNPKRHHITVKQHVSNDKEIAERYQPLIEEVYSLSPNISVEFIEAEEWKVRMGAWATEPHLRGDPPGFRPGYDHCRKRGITPVTYFPRFKFPDTKVTGKYVVLYPKAGNPKQDNRDMKIMEMESIVHRYPNHKFVLMGTDSKYADYQNHNVQNLVNKTTLLEAMGIVAGASSFIGVQGLMPFVSTSQKVPSFVYTFTANHTSGFVGRLFPTWINYTTICIKSWSEEPNLLDQFMDRCLP